MLETFQMENPCKYLKLLQKKFSGEEFFNCLNKFKPRIVHHGLYCWWNDLWVISMWHDIRKLPHCFSTFFLLLLFYWVIAILRIGNKFNSLAHLLFLWKTFPSFSFFVYREIPLASVCLRSSDMEGLKTRFSARNQSQQIHDGKINADNDGGKV